MKARSRLSGQFCELPGGGLVSDMFAGVDAPHDHLVPDGVDESHEYLGAWPDTLDHEVVGQVVQALAAATCWRDRVAVLPLVSAIDAAVRLSALDRHIIRDLPHLQSVCARPRLLLTIAEERLPIARARRFPERATAALVARPEDWEHRTLRGIRPNRVLATQIEDEWELYENCAAARLVDHLLEYLGRRVETLRAIQRTYEDGRDFLDDTRGSHRRAERLFELWGRLFDAPSLHDELIRSLAVLERAYHSLQALLDSPLYRHIPTNRPIPVSLRSTNIFGNDPHYRRIAALWRAWTRDGHVRRPTRAELARARQRQCRDFAQFAELIVLRALDGLEYSPADPTAELAAGIELAGPHRPLIVTREAAGELTLAVGEHRLRVVPMLCRLTNRDVASLWDTLVRAADCATVVLLLGRRSDLHVDPRLDRALTGWSDPRIIMVSPWSIDSVERTARVLSVWLAPRVLPSYPIALPVRPAPSVDLPKWIRRVGESFCVVAPAHDREIATFQAACSARCLVLEEARRRARISRHPFDPGELDALALLSQLADHARRLVPCTRCPICGQPDNHFEPRADGEPATWWCKCSACDAEWGTRTCIACRTAFPVLVPTAPHVRRDEVASPTDRIDRAFGRDLWAEPCLRPDRTGAFRCNNCRSCSGGECSSCLGAPERLTVATQPAYTSSAWRESVTT